MKPTTLLVEEHRLIERVVEILEAELHSIDTINQVNARLLDVIADFFKTYAQRTHLGKEEGILYKALSSKELVGEHRMLRHELMEDHILVWKLLGSLASARTRYDNGDGESANDIAFLLRGLAGLFTTHIVKEEKHFFIPCLEYLSRPEQYRVCQQFREYDWQMIHNGYQKVVSNLVDSRARIFS
jgi:hemerythrin-like domain-containing protein